MLVNKFLNVMEVMTKKEDQATSLINSILNGDVEKSPTVMGLINEMTDIRYNSILVSDIKSYNYKHISNKFYIVELKTFNGDILCLTDIDYEDNLNKAIVSGGYLYSTCYDTASILKEAAFKVTHDTLSFMESSLPKILRDIRVIKSRMTTVDLLDADFKPFRSVALTQLNATLNIVKDNFDVEMVTEHLKELKENIEYIGRSYEAFKTNIVIDYDGDPDTFNELLENVIKTIRIDGVTNE